MDHLSFASAYRTAAILAAFSQASTGGDMPSRGMRSVGLPRGLSWPESVRGALASLVAWVRPAAGPASHPGLASWSWSEGGARPMRQATDPSSSRLVSHFAFCDDAASWDDPRLG